MFNPFNPRKPRGFTLTELAIIIGVMGLVFGAIWLAVSSTYQNNKAQQAGREVDMIVQGYRSLYAGHPIDTADGTDLTCLGVNSGFFPADMVQNVACAGLNTYPQHPWGGPVQVISEQSWGAIYVGFSSLSQSACMRLAKQIFSAPDIVYEFMNGGGGAVLLPPVGAGTAYTQSQITNNCKPNSNNSIAVGYSAR
jgi:type II secretory pathway pseudopilin PulG